MAFNKELLQSELLVEFTTEMPQKTMTNHANALGTAYDNYCKLITTKYLSTLLTTGKSSFISTFISIIQVSIPILSNYGLAIESACISYWTSSSFPLISGIPLTMSSQASIKITPPVVGSMSSIITTKLSPGLNASSAAKELADAIDTATKTVTTLHSGPSKISPFPTITDGPNLLI